MATLTIIMNQHCVLVVLLLNVIFSANANTSNCPLNTTFHGGVCVQSSYFGSTIGGQGATSNTISNICSNPQNCLQPLPCNSQNLQVCPRSAICPQNTVMYNNKCVASQVASCPLNTVSQNGYCIAAGQQSIVQSAIPCASTPTMTCNEPQVCPQNLVMLGGGCVSQQIAQCPMNTNLQRGYCVNSIPAPAPIPVPYPVPIPAPPPVQPIQPYIPPPVQPIAPIQPYIPPPQPLQPQIIVVKDSNQAVHQPATPIEHTNIVNVTNIVNSTNVHNVITTANNSNINNISLGTNSHSENVVEKEEQCCVITEPRRCAKVNDKYKCFHRRRHVCGAECFRTETSYESPPPDRPQPPVFVVQPPAPPPPPPPPRPIFIQPPQQQIIMQRSPPPQIIVQRPPPPQQIIVQRPPPPQQIIMQPPPPPQQIIMQPPPPPQQIIMQPPPPPQQVIVHRPPPPQVIVRPAPIVQPQPVIVTQPVVQQGCVYPYVNCQPQQISGCTVC